MSTSNIIIICSDEHARPYSRCYGNAKIHSPALDKLSNRGTTFDNAYTPSPICVPARASLATGLQVHETRCWSSAEPYYGQHESWMHRLREEGHTVVSFGKLHFRSGDDDNGFTEEFLPMHATNNGLGWPQGLLRNPLPPFEETRELAEGVGKGESEYTQYDRRIASAACEWIGKYAKKTRGRKSWVMFISFVSPHYPLTAPEPYYNLYENCEFSLPFRPDPSELSAHPVIAEIRRFWDYDDYFDDELRIEAQRCYFGLVSFLDDRIKQVLHALDDSGLTSETLILYTSDHGEMLGHLGFWTKSVMYEDSVGIPLIATGPGFRRQRIKTPVSSTDIGATAEHAMSIRRCNRDIWSSHPLQKLSANNLEGRFAFSQYHDGGTPVSFYMIRSGNWKYVHYAASNRPELFNLAEDPAELNDLAQHSEHANRSESMRELLARILDPEATAKTCAKDQAERVACLGGRDAILNMKSFNHTPVAD